MTINCPPPFVCGEVFISKIDWPAIEVMKGERGVVFEVYDRKFCDDEDPPYGAQIIFENGGYCGFSPSEIKSFLERTNGVIPSLVEYKFKNVIQTIHDWHTGVFDPAFSKKGP